MDKYTCKSCGRGPVDANQELCQTCEDEVRCVQAGAAHRVIYRPPLPQNTRMQDFVWLALQRAIELNQETYHEGDLDEAIGDLVTAGLYEEVPGIYRLSLANGQSWRISVAPAPTDKPHYHDTPGDPENGPSPDDIPQPCWCNDPREDMPYNPHCCWQCAALGRDCPRHADEGVSADA